MTTIAVVNVTCQDEGEQAGFNGLTGFDRFWCAPSLKVDP
jgi:hypothetical protein